MARSCPRSLSWRSLVLLAPIACVGREVPAGSDGASTSTSSAPGSAGASTSATGLTAATAITATEITSEGASTTIDDPTDATVGTGACEPSRCEPGTTCDPESGACVPGCDDDRDCRDPLVCDLDTHTCSGCVHDDQCALGTICDQGACVPGCSGEQPCPGGLACCDGACVDLLTDVLHCGACDEACPPAAHAAAACALGACGLGACEPGFEDCDQSPANGCEGEGSCACEPGAAQPCYSGPPGTADVGLCASGTQVCDDDGAAWGPCTGEVVPVDEVCGDSKDNDCDGVVDEDPDADQDGYTVCGGDCCDAVGPACATPKLVNPGAFEIMGNDVDDDCDGAKDNPLALCDAGLASNAADPLDYARAIDLCRFTSENPAPKDKTWGVISGAFTRASGIGSPNANARSIRAGFGAQVKPKLGSRLAVLATGHAADAGDQSPSFQPFQGGTDLNAPASVPADWLAANGNNFPNAPGCPDPAGGATGYDTIQLRLRIRAPTNANSFSVMMYFLSSEYPEWVCSPYNDFFIALVDSADGGNPADKNIAIYKDQGKTWPVGVNLLKASSGLFKQCKNGTVSCGYPPQANYGGCVGQSELVGTGFDPVNPTPKFDGDPGYCGANNQVGGGTSWLKMSGNVVPGEVLEIRFVTWDTGDPWYDSLVLLDDWQWSVQASQPGVTPG